MKVCSIIFFGLLLGYATLFHEHTQADEKVTDIVQCVPHPKQDTADTLSQIRDFLYLLQAEDVSVSDLANNSFDLVIMDYAKYGDALSEYTRDEIAQIKSGGEMGVKKIVLAYMSIGEAEDYRFYWESSWQPGSPVWLGPTNVDWEGNYKVRYWMTGWKDIICGTASGPNKSYLDRIIDQGFDGVYLDIIDAYEYWSSPEGGNEKTRTQARTDMFNFLKELRDYALIDRDKADFLIFPQNGAGIIYDESEVVDFIGQQYLNLCDGIGQEDIWYMGTILQPQESYDRLTNILDIYKTNGKLVLSVDYVWDASNSNTTVNKNRYNDFYKKVYAKGFIPYAANSNRELKEIIQVSKGNGFVFDQPITDCLAVGAGLGINVPCANYSGNQYGFTLDFYRNVEYPSGFYWKLISSTLTTGTGAYCLQIEIDLSMPMDCVSYNGSQYGFTLRFYPNPYDPSGVYWVMDKSTLMVK